MIAVQDSVQYGSATLTYSILRAARKTLEIAVHPGGAIIVRAPKGTSQEEIQKRVLKRAGWLVRARNDFRSLRESEKSSKLFLNGATHYYLGKPFRLKIDQGDKESVKAVRGFIQVTTKGRTTQQTVRNNLEAWYRKRAESVFPEILEKAFPRFQRFATTPPRLQVRLLKKRWGSLSPKGKLTLNLALIRVPRECIEYVVVHELCHIEHHDHGKGFYRLLQKMMPDWERRKRKLEHGAF